MQHEQIECSSIEKQRKNFIFFAIKSVCMFLYTYLSISIACPNEIQFVTIDTKWTSHKACIQKKHVENPREKDDAQF